MGSELDVGAAKQAFGQYVAQAQAAGQPVTAPEFARFLQAYNPRLFQAFLAENTIDHLGTTTALPTYVAGWVLEVRYGLDLGRAAGPAWFALLGEVGTLFTLSCAISFMSSAYRDIQAWAENFRQLKADWFLAEEQLLIFKKRFCVLPDAEREMYRNALSGVIVDALTAARQQRLTVERFVKSSFMRKYFERRMQYVQQRNKLDEWIARLEQMQAEIARFSEDTQNPTQQLVAIDREIDAWIEQQQNVLHKARHSETQVDYTSGADNSALHAGMQSTALYAQRAQHLFEMFTYYPLVALSSQQQDKLEFNAYKKHLEALLKEEGIHQVPLALANHAYEAYTEKWEALSQYDVVSETTGGIPTQARQKQYDLLRCEYRMAYVVAKQKMRDSQVAITEIEVRIKQLALLKELKKPAAVESSHSEPEEALQPLLAESRSSGQSVQTDEKPRDLFDQNGDLDAMDKPQGSSAQPERTERRFFLKGQDSQTTVRWRKEWQEIRAFIRTFTQGLGVGLAQLLEPNEAAYEKSQAAHAGKWFAGLRNVLSNPGYYPKKMICSMDEWGPAGRALSFVPKVLLMVLQIPYFMYYAFTHLPVLFFHLKFAMDAIHQTVRHLDAALIPKAGEPWWAYLLIPIRFVAKIALNLVTWPFEALGGLGYVLLGPFAQRIELTQIAQATTRISGTVAALEQHRKDSHYGPFVDRLAKFSIWCVVAAGTLLNLITTPMRRILNFFSISGVSVPPSEVNYARTQLKTLWQQGSITGRAFFNDAFIEPSISLGYYLQQRYREVGQRYDLHYYRIGLLKYPHFLVITLQGIGLFVTNVLVLGLYRVIKNLLSTAPLVTVAVATTSALFPGGIIVTALATAGVTWTANATQLTAFTLIPLAGDTVNGLVHDTYNLADTLVTQDWQNRVQRRAMEAMVQQGLDWQDPDLYQQYQQAFAQAQWGEQWQQSMVQKRGKYTQQGVENNTSNKKNYTHAFITEPCFDSAQPPDVTAMLAAQLAYFLVNTSDRRQETEIASAFFLAQYESLKTYFAANVRVDAMAAAIEGQLELTANVAQQSTLQYNRALGLCSTLAFDYAYQLNAQRCDDWDAKSTQAWGWFLVSACGQVLEGKYHNNQIQFEDNGVTYTATSLSWWQRLWAWVTGTSSNMTHGYQLKDNNGNVLAKKEWSLMWQNSRECVDLNQGLLRAAQVASEPMAGALAAEPTSTTTGELMPSPQDSAVAENAEATLFVDTATQRKVHFAYQYADKLLPVAPAVTSPAAPEPGFSPPSKQSNSP